MANNTLGALQSLRQNAANTEQEVITPVDTIGVQTLTNKRNTKRVLTVTQSATPSTNTDNGDIISITGIAQNITSMTTNLSGTPVNGDMVMWQLTATGTFTLAWGTSFASAGATLPATLSTTMTRTLVQWNSVTSKWECIA